MRKIALKSPTLLAFALGAAHLSAAGVDVPGSARVAAVRFQAGREPIRFDLAWDNGSNRTLTVQPKDTALIINSNVGKKYPTSQAGFEFKGLGVVDFVRPNVTIYRKAIREGYTNDWDSLPEIYGRAYRLEFRQQPDGAEVWINGNYAGRFPAGDGARLARIDSPFAEKAFEFSDRPADPKYLPLEIGPLDRPGAMTNAAVTLDDHRIPFLDPAAANLDVGVTTSHYGLYPGSYGDSGYTGRNAFDHARDSYLFTVPMRQYSHAWLLCAVEEDPSKTATVNVRLTRFVPSTHMGGRAYSAIADTLCAVPGPNAKRVGTVSVNGRTLPLWRVEARLDLGKVIDLVTHPHGRWGRGAFPMHYLDFEITGELHKRRTPFGDPRPYPDPAKPSAVHVFGVTLERASADLVFGQSQPGNLFADDEKPEMTAAVKPAVPGTYTLRWSIEDAEGRPAGGGRFTTSSAAEKTLDLRQKDLGWYGLVFRLFDDRAGRLITEHRAAYALLGPDTRQAGFESPYLGWTFGAAHYQDGRPEVVGALARKAGVRRARGVAHVSGQFQSEKDYAPWKLTEVLVYSGSKVTRTDEEVKTLIADKLEKWPHANQVLVFWESARPFDVYAIAPELVGRPPLPYTEARQAAADERWAFVEQTARVVRKEFPQLKVLLGNSLSCGELVAEVLRRKPPKGWFTHLGTEAINRTVHPEKPGHNFTTLASRWLADTAKALGYEYPVTYCPEGISRKPDTLGERVCTEWLVRDILVQHALGFEDISGVGIHPESGNIYDGSFYGICALGRTPFMYPRLGYVATATLTRVLDRARFERFFPTGSDTVYAAEFSRPDGRKVYALWTSRGTAELSIEPGSREVELVSLYGRSSRPPVWQRWRKRLTLTAGTGARYLVTDTPLRAIACGRRAYPDNPVLPGFRVVDAVDSLSRWQPETETNRTFETAGHYVINGITNVGADHRTLAVRPAVREVRDPEKGACLEIAIESNTNHHRLMQEYAVLMLKDPIALPPDAHTVGLWVKGNSGWGHVAWILKDAAGRTYASRSGIVGDYTGRASIDFDGWCFLSQPATADSPIPELSTGGLSHLWGGTAKPPFQLAGLAFCAPAHPLYINEYKARPQSIRIKDVSVLSGP